MTRRRQDALQRLLDVGLVVVTSPVWLPLALLVAVLVRVVDGPPVLFRQERVGHHGRTFLLYKFRTMYATTEERFGPPLASETTRLGTLLRRTSLDELPQLVNVLRGEMSLVGPRPVRPAHLDRSPCFRGERLSVPPGLTGLAQVAGRNEMSWAARLHLDSEYVRRRSLGLYLRILLTTVKAAVVHRSEHPASALTDPFGTSPVARTSPAGDRVTYDK